MKKTVHIISHSHWDREWYMPFEHHRAYLVKLIDECMELFEKDENFKSFHLDGHTALLEDYLEIKPENKEKIKKYIEEGKFVIGPWYILQDEFLTSSEANIRNLLVGGSLTKQFGKSSKIGYFPDSFGNAGQMPQILKQAGMDAIVFGRGVKPTGMNNAVADGYTSQFSEMYWQSPDGSKLPAILFANWYNNAMEIPENGDMEYWNKRLANVEKYASTNQLLMMNGCDHQPVQKNLTDAIKASQQNYPEYRFLHSSFAEYTDALMRELPENLEVITGELIGQDTDGWFTLVNTCSSNIDLKVMNRECEILLENVAEPLSTIAMKLGKEYPHEMLDYAWKTLMKNHPHDSICGCSCDAVNEEVKIRFVKSSQAAESIIKDDLGYIASRIETTGFEGCDAVFAVINTFAKRRSAIISADVDLQRIYGAENLNQSCLKIKDSLHSGGYELIDKNGNIIPCNVYNCKARFGYDLPEDGFRKPYFAETVTVSFEAYDLNPMGYNVYGIRKIADNAENTIPENENILENQYIKAVINKDGTLNVFDKCTGCEFNNLMQFEDVGDIGTEYTFVPTSGGSAIYPSGKADVELVRNERYVTEYKVTVYMNIPLSADECAENERSTFVGIKERVGGRSDTFTTIPVTYYVSLSEHGKRLDVKIEFTNTAKDHRLRVLFPTHLNKCTHHKVESVFESVKRDNQHKESWTYPSGCEHQQGFVMMNDEKGGIAVANIGLYEYEIVNGDTIAVTLVRAVAEMGDWGVFPTELSQQQKSLSLQLSLIPYGDEDTVYTEASSFQCPIQTVQLFDNTDNSFKNNQFMWDGKDLRLTAFKASQENEDIVMRWVNYCDEPRNLTIYKTEWIDNVCLSNVLEEPGEEIKASEGKWTVTLKPFEIKTFKCIKR